MSFYLLDFSTNWVYKMNDIPINLQFSKKDMCTHIFLAFNATTKCSYFAVALFLYLYLFGRITWYHIGKIYFYNLVTYKIIDFTKWKKCFLVAEMSPNINTSYYKIWIHLDIGYFRTLSPFRKIEMWQMVENNIPTIILLTLPRISVR